METLIRAAALLCWAAQAPASPMGERLVALLAETDAQGMALNLQVAVQRGDLPHAGEFGDSISDALYQRAEANLREQLNKLAAIDRGQLDARPHQQAAAGIRRFHATAAKRGKTTGS